MPNDEMHTDGGTVTQVFFYGGVIDLRAAVNEVAGLASSDVGDLYAIRNGQLSPEARQIERKLPEISERALSTTIKTAAMNNLYRIYAFTRRDNVGFHYVDIPDSYVSQSAELFDRTEMNRLFEIGYLLGLSGDAWRSEPPGFELPVAQL